MALPLPPPELLDGSTPLDRPEAYEERAGQVAEALRPMLPDQLGDVLQVDCGTGAVLRGFAVAVAGGSASAVGAETDAAKVSWARASLEPLRFEAVLDPPRLPFEDAQFDLVIALTTFLDDDADWSVALAEIARVTRPGGRLVAAVASPSDYTERTARRWAEDEVGREVVEDLDGTRRAYQSRWWIEAHWGPAFDAIDFAERPFAGLEELDGLDLVLARRGQQAAGAERLAADSGDPRETRARARQAAWERDLVDALRSELDALRARHEELVELHRGTQERLDAALQARDFFEAENAHLLARQAGDDAEQARPPSDPDGAALSLRNAALETEVERLGELLDATHHQVNVMVASTSWRVTRPLRAFMDRQV